ncbi:hypothetical protein CP533_0192 [Ophiocordyceps camponoti-saundersi (nom. inval.)]|nr:hypothetical protein CP533_0192 [Ophiocordyceps camponoti-saundersi (nom. inval.)]
MFLRLTSLHLRPLLNGSLSLTCPANGRLQGDNPVLTAAWTKIGCAFREKASLDPSSKEAQKAIERAKDLARFLRCNVVQGERVHPDGDTYKLRIHEHTELGDNDTIGNTCKR